MVGYTAEGPLYPLEGSVGAYLSRLYRPEVLRGGFSSMLITRDEFLAAIRGERSDKLALKGGQRSSVTTHLVGSDLQRFVREVADEDESLMVMLMWNA